MRKIFDWFMLNCISPIDFTPIKKMLTGRQFNLTVDDLTYLYDLLKSDNYIILTRRNMHFTTYLISIGHFLLTGRFARYAHICMNIEDNTDVKILEAVGSGVKISKFKDVFNCDAYCVIEPTMVSRFEWQFALQKSLKENINKKYDTIFNIGSDAELSCGELVIDTIRNIVNYELRFKYTLDLIKREKQITPQMFYENPDFKIVREVVR